MSVETSINRDLEDTLSDATTTAWSLIPKKKQGDAGDHSAEMATSGQEET